MKSKGPKFNRRAEPAQNVSVRAYYRAGHGRICHRGGTAIQVSHNREPRHTSSLGATNTTDMDIDDLVAMDAIAGSITTFPLVQQVFEMVRLGRERRARRHAPVTKKVRPVLVSTC